ncbi:MAG TPA: DNA gyrase subunit B, partial [Hyphomicrobiaceae bacterium]|nr:DNA gyrase subunit B [Hyphomicrobiaceae bacterium]
VERGHLYIAQPPLYKVMRGKSETYLKDERALEDYLIRAGLNDCVLKLATGEGRTGNDLREVIEQARGIASVLDGLHTRYSRAVVTQAAIAGALVPT